MIAAGIASFFIGLFHVLAVAMGPASVIGFISIAPRSVPSFMIGIVISIVIGFKHLLLWKKTYGTAKQMVNQKEQKQLSQSVRETPKTTREHAR